MASDDDSTTFEFETEFVASMRCIPMAIRRKLDLAGVKLSLKEWSQLPVDDRAALLQAPADEQFRERARTAVAARTGQAPRDLPPVSDEPWMRVDAVPAEIVEKARAQGVELTMARWTALSSLQRFALVKLGRPSHESESFALALAEFGLRNASET
jgi:hypothetical protein